MVHLNGWYLNLLSGNYCRIGWLQESKIRRLLPPLLLNKCDPDLDAQVEFVRHVQQLHRTANLEEIFWF